jgi:hypothetical protein
MERLVSPPINPPRERFEVLSAHERLPQKTKTEPHRHFEGGSITRRCSPRADEPVRPERDRIHLRFLKPHFGTAAFRARRRRVPRFDDDEIALTTARSPAPGRDFAERRAGRVELHSAAAAAAPVRVIDEVERFGTELQPRAV